MTKPNTGVYLKSAVHDFGYTGKKYKFTIIFFASAEYNRSMHIQERKV